MTTLLPWGAVSEIRRDQGKVRFTDRLRDNAVAESFFGTLKSELGDTFPSRALAEVSVADYIDNFYNPVRRHSTLDYLSPIEYELRYETEITTP